MTYILWREEDNTVMWSIALWWQPLPVPMPLGYILFEGSKILMDSTSLFLSLYFTLSLLPSLSLSAHCCKISVSPGAILCKEDVSILKKIHSELWVYVTVQFVVLDESTSIWTEYGSITEILDETGKRVTGRKIYCEDIFTIVNSINFRICTRAEYRQQTESSINDPSISPMALSPVMINVTRKMQRP